MVILVRGNQCQRPILYEMGYRREIKLETQSLPMYKSYDEFLKKEKDSTKVYQFSSKDYPQLAPLFELAKAIAPDIEEIEELERKMSVQMNKRLLQECMNGSPNPKVMERLNPIRGRVEYYSDPKSRREVHYCNNTYWKVGNLGVLQGRWSVEKWDEFYDRGDGPEGIIDKMNDWMDMFGTIHKSGHFYYLPGSVREWHTNRWAAGPGYRAYIIRHGKRGGHTSGIKYLNMYNNETVDVPDLEEMHINLFRIRKEPAFWHCVYNKDVHRFSVGLKLSLWDTFKLLLLTNEALDGDGTYKYWEDVYREEEEKVIKDINNFGM